MQPSLSIRYASRFTRNWSSDGCPQWPIGASSVWINLVIAVRLIDNRRTDRTTSVSPARKGASIMASVKQLGYLALHASDLAGWAKFATEVLGLAVVPGDDAS